MLCLIELCVYSYYIMCVLTDVHTCISNVEHFSLMLVKKLGFIVFFQIGSLENKF